MRKQHEIFEKLVNELINDVLNLYANDAEDLETYAFGWRKYIPKGPVFYIGPMHGKSFYYVDEVAKIAEACKMNWYITIGENADGNESPVMRVF